MKIRIYASGNGSLTFVWESGGNALPDKVTMQQARQAMIDYRNPYEGFTLIESHGQPLLIPEVKREGNALLYNGGEYIEKEGHFFAWYKEAQAYHRIKNINIIAALRYFLNSEAA